MHILAYYIQDTQYHLIMCINNMLSHLDYCERLIDADVLSLIFTLAKSPSVHVKTICSTSLHMISDRLPNAENPEVIQLLLYPLEIKADLDEDKYEAERKELSNEELFGADFPSVKYSYYVHEDDKFTSVWSPIICEIEHEPPLIFVRPLTMDPIAFEIRPTLRSGQDEEEGAEAVKANLAKYNADTFQDYMDALEMEQAPPPRQRVPDAIRTDITDKDKLSVGDKDHTQATARRSPGKTFSPSHGSRSQKQIRRSIATMRKNSPMRTSSRSLLGQGRPDSGPRPGSGNGPQRPSRMSMKGSSSGRLLTPEGLLSMGQNSGSHRGRLFSVKKGKSNRDLIEEMVSTNRYIIIIPFPI